MSRMSRANGITRQEILTSIKCHGAMTAEELSRELNISQVAVRQHLASLEAENIVAVTVERRGLGRPSHRYHLTPQGDETFPRHYDSLASGLLDELQAWQGEEAIDTLLARKRERSLFNLQSRVKNKSLPARLDEVARFLSDQGYMAEVVEDGSGELRLIQHNCAVCAVARNHPAICCEGDITWLRQLLGDIDIVREKYILHGDHTCTFRIQSRKSRE